MWALRKWVSLHTCTNKCCYFKGRNNTSQTRLFFISEKTEAILNLGPKYLSNYLKNTINEFLTHSINYTSLCGELMEIPSKHDTLTYFGLMWVHRLRRCPDIKPTSGECHMFVHRPTVLCILFYYILAAILNIRL